MNAKVVSIKENCIRIKDGEEIDYDILIGADGPNSLVARHLRVKHQFTTACQYKIICDTSNMDYLEFYVDRRFSPDYSWIFPKEGIINVGIEGNFASLDTFLAYKGLSSHKIVEKEAGVIPTSGIKKLAWRNIALIGDAAAMTNPFSGNGLTPIIYAGDILVRHLTNLESYEMEVKKHPITSPILFKARQGLLKLADDDLVGLLSFLTGVSPERQDYLYIGSIVKGLSLLPKLQLLMRTYRAIKITKTYGW